MKRVMSAFLVLALPNFTVFFVPDYDTSREWIREVLMWN
jgi:hypothetical protein